MKKKGYFFEKTLLYFQILFVVLHIH